MLVFGSLEFHWWVWIAIALISAAPHIYHLAFWNALRGIARCCSWGACPLFISLLVISSIELFLGPESENVPSMLAVFDFKSAFTGYGLAVTIGMLFGTLGSYIPALDIFFSAGSPSGSQRREAEIRTYIGHEKNVNGNNQE